MKNIVSFVLYGTRDRYWHPVPFVLSTTAAVYPDYTIRVHVHQDAVETPGFKVLDHIARKTSGVEIEFFSRPYAGKDTTFPCLERLKPIWDPSVGYVLCRDLDACASTDEIKAVRVFMKSGRPVHSIRSYLHHTVPIMGGLCGFVAPEVRKKLPLTFVQCLAFAAGVVDPERQKEFGTDLSALEAIFRPLLPDTLDTMMKTAKYIPYPAIHIDDEVYKHTDVRDLSPDLLELLDGLVEWPGKPLKIENSVLWQMLDITLNPVSMTVRKFLKEDPAGAPWRI